VSVFSSGTWFAIARERQMVSGKAGPESPAQQANENPTAARQPFAVRFSDKFLQKEEMNGIPY
jgi:hypothetical protein